MASVRLMVRLSETRKKNKEQMSIYHRLGHMKCGMPEMVYAHLKTDKNQCEISNLRLVVTILGMLPGERFIVNYRASRRRLLLLVI